MFVCLFVDNSLILNITTLLRGEGRGGKAGGEGRRGRQEGRAGGEGSSQFERQQQMRRRGKQQPMRRRGKQHPMRR